MAVSPSPGGHYNARMVTRPKCLHCHFLVPACLLYSIYHKASCNMNNGCAGVQGRVGMDARLLPNQSLFNLTSPSVNTALASLTTANFRASLSTSFRTCAGHHNTVRLRGASD